MWTPTLPEGPAPLYHRLADALAADIAAGQLDVGARLPPHRELAWRLSLGVGTVTKAYEEAERRGLIEARVGRGSFVARPPVPMHQRDHGPLDLAMNIAPVGPSLARLPEAMKALGKRHDLTERFAYAPSLGMEADRRAGARWLAETSGFEGAEWQRTLCTLGAQHAMSLLLGVLLQPGDVILTEALNYIGLKALCTHAGYKLHGVTMDAEGMQPEALARAARETGARLLYAVPTLHNPTARVMSAARRSEIAAVARTHDLTIVEDDIYGHFARDLALPPLAALAPERTWLLSGLSKAVAPGLRAGYLHAPDDRYLDALTQAARATVFAPPGLPFAVATQMIESGMAREIVQEVSTEIATRTVTAREALDGFVETPACAASLHLWLPLDELEAERVAGRAMRSGLSLLAPGAGAIGPHAEPGLRISLGSIADRTTLAKALGLMRAALSGDVTPPASGLI